MPKRYRKEQPVTWFAVGHNNYGNAPSTWFYCFDSHYAAAKFITGAEALDPTIGWTAYPCVMDTMASALNSFHTALKEQS